MKKIFILSTVIIYQLSFIITNAQLTTLLPNRLSMPNISTLGTCDNASKGSTVFNTTDNKMYYCNGTNWQEMTGGGFTLPYVATQAGGNVTALINLKNIPLGGWGIVGEAPSGMGIFGKSSTGIGVYGYSDDNYGVSGYSQDGIGVRAISQFGTGGYFESDEGYAIEVKGKMRINSTIGVGGGQITIPTNGGDPIWQDPIAFSVNDLGTVNLSVASTLDKKIPSAKDFDLGNDFSLTNSEFTAPVKGIYHLDAFAMWNAHKRYRNFGDYLQN